MTCDVTSGSFCGEERYCSYFHEHVSARKSRIGHQLALPPMAVLLYFIVPVPNSARALTCQYSTFVSVLRANGATVPT